MSIDKLFFKNQTTHIKILFFSFLILTFFKQLLIKFLTIITHETVPGSLHTHHRVIWTFFSRQYSRKIGLDLK